MKQGWLCLWGAMRSQHKDRYLKVIEESVLPRFTVLAYDADTARIYGEVSAQLEKKGMKLADADIQIGATTMRYGLTLVTGNIRHFERVEGLQVLDFRAV